MKIRPEVLEYPDNLYNVCDIPALNMDESRALYIPQGSVASLDLEHKGRAFWARQVFQPPHVNKGILDFDRGLSTMYSQGAILSSTFIAYSTDSLTMAQIQPGNDRLCTEVRAGMKSTERHLGALLIRGSLSNKPDILLHWLDKNNISYDEVSVETGNSHFGVVLDIVSGTVSVATKTPRREVLQYSYNPFITR